MNNEWRVIIRYGEISIKSRNTRKHMEKILVNNIYDALKTKSIRSRVLVGRGRLYLQGFREYSEAEKASQIITHVMGIVSTSPAKHIVFNNMAELIRNAISFFKDRIRGKSFAVRVNRIGKHEFTSLDIARIIGKYIWRDGIRVDLENPDYTAYVEIRGNHAFFYDTIYYGVGGLPVGSGGRVLALFSGGIDSPVASWYMLKRGCLVDLVLFDLGGKEQVDSVIRNASYLMKNWGYGYQPELFIVNFRKIVSKIIMKIPDEYLVIILRRLMMKTAGILAEKIGAKALVTGESLGQVASQTLDNLYVIDEASKLPVLRPLIGFDKEEIIRIARMIGTYQYSIETKEYCLIGARKTITRARLDKVYSIENKLDIQEKHLHELVEKAQIYRLRSI